MFPTSMGPSTSRRSRVPLAAAVVLTLVLVPFIIKDLTGDEPGPTAPDRAAAPTSTTAKDAVEVSPSPPVGEQAPVVIDPSWAAKGTSVFGESEAETLARIDRRRSTVAEPEQPTGTVTTTTRPVSADGPPTSASAPASSAPKPVPTAAPAPRPTSAPTTAAPTTAAPTTAVVTTTAPQAAAGNVPAKPVNNAGG